MNEELQNVDVNTKEQEAPKTYTQEEVMALLQSEADKRVQQRLSRNNKRNMKSNYLYLVLMNSKERKQKKI